MDKKRKLSRAEEAATRKSSKQTNTSSKTLIL